MSMNKKIIWNTAVQMVWRILTAILALVSVKLITKTLGVEWYGIYATIYEFLALFAIAGDFGIYTVALRDMAKDRDKAPYIFQNILWLRGVLMAIVMLISVLVVYLVPKYQGTLIPSWVLITAIAVYVNLVYWIVTTILQLHLKMEYSTYGLVWGKIFSVAIIAYWAFFETEYSSSFYVFLYSGIIGNLVMLWITVYYCKRFTPISPKFDFKYWLELFARAAPYWIALILGTIYVKISIIFLSIYRSHEEVWLFAIWIRLVEVFTVLPMFFMNSILPSLTEEVAKLKSWIHKVDSVMNFTFSFMMITSLPLVLGSYLISKDLISLVASKDFLSWWQYLYGWDTVLMLLMTAMFFSFFSNAVSVSFIAFNKQKSVLFMNTLWVIVNIILNILFIPSYWFIAAWIISIISEITILVAWIILFRHTYQILFEYKPLVKIITSSLIMFVVWYITKTMIYDSMTLIILICSATYLVALNYFGILSSHLLKRE